MGFLDTHRPLAVSTDTVTRNKSLIEQAVAGMEAAIAQRRAFEAKVAAQKHAQEADRQAWFDNIPMYIPQALEVIEQRGGDPE